MQKLIGRKYEISQLKEALNNNKSELIAVYGRRRVGKTFLIRNFFEEELVFDITGLYKGSMTDQLVNFTKEISKKSKRKPINLPSNWFEAFTLLENYLDTQKSKKKKVIFIDEFPWIAIARSKFLMAFEKNRRRPWGYLRWHPTVASSRRPWWDREASHVE